jgi:hypothetical protein
MSSLNRVIRRPSTWRNCERCLQDDSGALPHSIKDTMMDRKYCRIVYKPWNDSISVDEAIAIGDYAKKYYLDADTVGRIDYWFQRLGLCKVSYRQTEPPFDAVQAEHFNKFPDGVSCEIVAPGFVNEESLLVEMVSLYTTPTDLEFHGQQFLNEKGWVVKSIRIGPDGQPEGEEHPRYNEHGEIIGRKVYDGTGKLLYGEDYSEDH